MSVSLRFVAFPVQCVSISLPFMRLCIAFLLSLVIFCRFVHSRYRHSVSQRGHQLRFPQEFRDLPPPYRPLRAFRPPWPCDQPHHLRRPLQPLQDRAGAGHGNPSHPTGHRPQLVLPIRQCTPMLGEEIFTLSASLAGSPTSTDVPSPAEFYWEIWRTSNVACLYISSKQPTPNQNPNRRNERTHADEQRQFRNKYNHNKLHLRSVFRFGLLSSIVYRKHACQPPLPGETPALGVTSHANQYTVFGLV